MSFCHNDETLLRNSVRSSICPCQRSDFDCAFGYERKLDRDDGIEKCVKSDHVKNGVDKPLFCLHGKVYFVDEDQKYRKIPGDKCNETHPSSFSTSSRELTKLEPERDCDPESRMNLLIRTTEAPDEPKTAAQKVALAAIICVSILMFALLTLFFVRKFVALRKITDTDCSHLIEIQDEEEPESTAPPNRARFWRWGFKWGKDRGSYRYSSVRATDDDEFEALLPNGNANDADNNVFGDYVVAAADDFDLEMELERGLAELNAPLPSASSSSSSSSSKPAPSSPPRLPVSASKSPVKATNISAVVRSYATDDDDDLIA